MKAIASSLLLALLLAASLPLTAEAGGRYAWGGGHHRYGHGGYYYGGHYRHHGHYDGGDVALAFGVGAVLGLFSGWATAPVYAAPPYRTYRAPTRVVTCVEDEVWRYLPDGRIQTGVRRTCY